MILATLALVLLGVAALECVAALFLYVMAWRRRRRHLECVRRLVRAQSEINGLFNQGATYRWVANPDDGIERPFSAAAHEACGRALHKSMELLKSKLTPAQLEQFLRGQFFDVIGSHSGRRYRIDSRFASFNVFMLDGEGNAVDALCFTPKGGLPRGDVLLTQKIYLENCEDEAWRVANQRNAYQGDGRYLWQ